MGVKGCRNRGRREAGRTRGGWRRPGLKKGLPQVEDRVPSAIKYVGERCGGV